MTNFNPYTGNKKPYGAKKKAKPSGKSYKGGKLKMGSGGEIVDDLDGTETVYSPGTVPKVEFALEKAGVGNAKPVAAAKKVSSATPTTVEHSLTNDESKKGKGKTFAEVKAEQDAKFAARKKKKKN